MSLIRLLAAGACYDGSVFSRCALQPSECDASQTFRSSRWLSSNDSGNAGPCAEQGSIHMIPALGRCDSASERYICTSHKSACFLDVSFRGYDPDCTVLHDYHPIDTPFIRSYYGECVPTEQGIAQSRERFCAWQFNECPSGGLYTFESADEFFAGQFPSCRCDKMKTGACVSSSDPSEYFCAVTSAVCESEPGFTYYKATDVEENLDTTCMLCDSLPDSNKVLYAQAGACVVDSTNEFKRCALLPDHCSGQGESFYSPRQVTSSPNIPSLAKGCLTQQGLHRVRVGRCATASDQNICVPDASACKISQSFQANDPDCLLVEDLSPSSALRTTHFGHCTADEMTTFSGYQPGRESYCVWSIRECQSSTPNARTYQFGNANPGMSGSFPTCQCDDVRTGACINDANKRDMYCATGTSACDTGFTYYNVRALEDPSGPNTVCYLCESLPPGNVAPPSAPTNPTSPIPKPNSPPAPSSPNPSPDMTPSSPQVPTLEEELEKELANDGIAVGAVIGIILGVFITTCIFTLVICLFLRNKQDDRGGRRGTAASPEPENNRTSAAPTHHDQTMTNRANETVSMEPGQTEEDFVPEKEHNLL